MIHPQPTPRRRASAWKGWLAFISLCAGFAAIEWAVESAARRNDAIELHNDRVARDLEDRIRLSYPSRDLIPQLERDLNGGRPLPQVRIDRSFGWFDRIVVNGSAVDPNVPGWKGWHVQIDYSASPASAWTFIRAIPPPERPGFSGRIGTAEARRFIEQFRRLVLVLGALVWAIAIALAPVAGPLRRKLGQVAVAAALLALLAWAADHAPLNVAGLPPFDWICGAAIGGLLIGLLAVALPVRVRQYRIDRCSACGYDLTANVSGVCPECGQLTPAELRRRRDAELAPLADAIEQTEMEPAEDADPVTDTSE